MATQPPVYYTNSAQQAAFAAKWTETNGDVVASKAAAAEVQAGNTLEIETNANDVDSPTGILRYPYEALTESTDYFRIIIKERKNTGIIEGSESFKNTGFGGNLGGSKSINGNKMSLSSPTTLSKGGVILLPIPSNVTDSNSVSYNGGSMNSISAAALNASVNVMQEGFGGLVSGESLRITKAAFDSVGGENAKNLIQQQLAVNAVNVFGANVSLDQLLARAQGKIFNPNMELLFDGVKLRSFNFQFKLTPRDVNESKQIKYIIRSLKKNMAAKTVDQGNLYLKTPNVFELSYMRGSTLHPFLNKFKQAALTDIKVNYTAENVYATYDDSTPISMILDLSFQELVPIYEKDYDSAEGSTGVGY